MHSGHACTASVINTLDKVLIAFTLTTIADLVKLKVYGTT